MSYVSVLPATLATAATEVARIGSALSLASAVAAAQTSAVQAAAADEVSAAIAALFSAHGRDFQALSARAAAFHHEFVQALAAGAGSYAVAEIAAASPLQSLIDVFNAPIQAATGRPLIGNGANGQPGTGAPGGPGARLAVG
ncbi:PE family protein, partial [Mycobacterium tuberculosis]|uniref:PE family protein n=4 Tax=Mycobacterium tuberculosis TaxID=1773 RepID=UPI000B06E6C7